MKTCWKYFMLLVSFILIGCSTNQEDNMQSDGGLSTGDSDMRDEAAVTGQSDAIEEGLIGEKVITTIYLEYETLLYEESREHILETVREQNAYVEYSYESQYTPAGSFGADPKKFRRVDYTVRVPKENLELFMDALMGMDAEKISEQIGSEDATKNYRDTESRIRVLNQKETRLNELLEQAETIEQILQIEDNLSQTIAEREILQSQLDQIDDLIDYTAVHVQLLERQRISNTRNQSQSFWERIREALLDSLYSFYYWVQDAAIWLIYAIPYIVIIVLITMVIILIRKTIRKKKK
ncbi:MULTISPECIES: DUF4349 domain-containing protein [unclassified Jeotgalibaca]|uniref:DUF4349 domain-containing protein n=1 Tax=unclassified Jeotgalibaca TaxID=2621505 RepID=UPI003FD2556C